MQNLTNIKTKGQQEWNRLVEAGKQQPEQVKLWGGTAAAAAVGGVAVAAVAKGLAAIISTLASPPVALIIGAVAGGVWGWSYLQDNGSSTATATETLGEVPIQANANETTASTTTA